MGAALPSLLEPCCGAPSVVDRQVEEDINRNVSASVSGISYSVCFDRIGDDRLGLDVGRTTGGELLVQGVTGGLAQRWNQAHPDRRISVGDSVVDVNGVRSNAEAMLDRLKQDSHLEMRLVQGAGSHADGAASAAHHSQAEAGGGTDFTSALHQMSEMGIPESQAREALQLTGGNLEQALAIASASDPTVDDLLAGGGFVPPPPPSGAEMATAVQALVAMGFPEDQAKVALEMAGGDVQQAAAALAQGGGGNVDPQKLQDLVAMGFPEQRARQALDSAGGNLEQATAMLLSDT